MSSVWLESDTARIKSRKVVSQSTIFCVLINESLRYCVVVFENWMFMLLHLQMTVYGHDVESFCVCACWGEPCANNFLCKHSKLMPPLLCCKEGTIVGNASSCVCFVESRRRDPIKNSLRVPRNYWAWWDVHACHHVHFSKQSISLLK